MWLENLTKLSFFFGLVISAKYTCSNYCTGTSAFFFLIFKKIIEENK